VDPDPVDARVATIEAALGAGDFAGARSIAEAVLADHPRHGLARLLLGVALNKLLLYQRARPELEAVVRGGPTFEKYDETWYFLGWALFNSGELALARDAFEKHLERRPNEGDSHFALGLIDLEDGDEEGALGRFQRSIELNRAAVDAGNKGRLPDVAKAHARIADIYLARDEVEAAVEELERCVTLWPAHYNAWFKLHRAHTLLGNDELAAASMRQHDHWKAQAQGAKTP
jgi:tetratricopeptide (TPR) repeat protein